LGKTWVKGKTG